MASLIIVLIGIAIVVMVGVAVWLTAWPTIKPRNGYTYSNTMMRARTVLIDRDHFGAGEVLYGDKQGKDKISYRVRLESGGEIQTETYSKWQLEPLDVFQAICDDKAPVYIVSWDKAKLEGDTKSAELLQQIERWQVKYDELAGRYAKLNADIDHEVETRINSQIELSKANKLASKPMART